jgi:Family of unknown function (DUF6088)
MEPLAKSIMRKVETLAEGTPISAKMLLALGTRAGVDQALSRLHRRGQILRIGRGLYVLPVASRFGKHAPTPEKVVKAFAAQRGETITSSPAAAANAMGLTTQVPVRSIYYTSGRSRKLRLGKQQVELKHAPGWQLGSGNEGELVRALTWGGPSRIQESLGSLSKKFSSTEFERVVQIGARLPTWILEPVSRQMRHG